MQTHAFALAIVNDLFDEDLDPDLFGDAVEDAVPGMAVDACVVPLDGSRPGPAARPALVAGRATRRSSTAIGPSRMWWSRRSAHASPAICTTSSPTRSPS